MQNLISNELLIEVFNKNVIYARIYNKNLLNITWDSNKENNVGTTINIFELAFKMKQWAKNKEYTIISGYNNDFMGEKYNKRVFGYCCQIQDKEFNIKDFYEDNEINAIVKACEYIRKELLK